MAQPFSPVRNPNDVWSADFKGQFLAADGLWCYPLTVMDHKSRYVFKVHGLGGTGGAPVKKEFKSIFRAYGMPWRIRTDNGTPFASRSVGGLSKLSKWWIRLGIVPERIEPGKPQQNGRHERMHRTLKADACGGPQCSMGRLQKRFEEFRMVYNEERPHESLGQLTPSSAYHSSERVYPEKLPELEYPGHYRVLRATSVGLIYVNSFAVYVGHVLAGENVGLEQVDEDIWDVYFGALRLGGFSAKETNNRKDTGYRTLKV
jgi:hypothetical protein